MVKSMLYKSGGKIHIKKSHKGLFTDYCGGKVTEECIQRGKRSSNPKIRRRATFADNARHWKHQNGGTIKPSFDDWYATVPKEYADTTNYNLRRAYQLAPFEEMEAWRNNPEENHLSTGYWNDNGEFEFMKYPNHSTIQEELNWFNSDDAEAFRKSYELDTNSTPWKYKLKNIWENGYNIARVLPKAIYPQAKLELLNKLISNTDLSKIDLSKMDSRPRTRTIGFFTSINPYERTRIIENGGKA